MKHFDISKEEKKRILGLHNMDVTDINEQKLIWDDPGNKKALSGYLDMGKPKRKYRLEIKEPFTFETLDQDELHKVRFILIKNRVKFDEFEEKVEY